MFTWLNNLFPYSDLHSLNLDWILNKMKETAAQAAKAIADSANALAQVLEAKIAAQNAQTAAENAQTAANNAQTAANNAADSAENAVTVAQSAQTAAQSAKTAAQNAQNAANAAQTAANAAQTAAENAQNTANAAQTAAENAQNTANGINNKFPIKSSDISDSAVTGVKIAKRTINGEKLSFSTINAGFESYSSSTDVTATIISANEISFTFPIQGGSSFVNNSAAFIRLVKPSTVAEGKKYIKTSTFPANRTGDHATFDCERRLIIGEIFDNNNNELGICIIKASTVYGVKDDGSKGWTGNLKLLYCTTEVNFTDMNGQIGVNTVKLTNLA